MNLSDRTVLAKRYAHAYLSVSKDHSSDFDAMTFYDASTLLHSNAHIIAILSYLSDTAFNRCVEQFLLQCSLPSSLQSLLLLLRSNKRISLLGSVLFSIGNALDQLHNVHRATLYSEPLLDKEQVDVIGGYISELVNGSVRFNVQQDPLLIAGLRIVGKDWSWEKSIAKKIRMLQAVCLQHVT